MAGGNRAALYARVSTEEQALTGYSLEAQIEKMHLFCEINDLEIAGEYIDDGYSGTNKRRPAYRRMFTEDRSKWDVLVVLKMDRIHRNSMNFMEMMKDLRDHGQEFISTFDKFNTTTAAGRFALDTIQRIAQLESEQIGERTYMGMREKAETGGGVMGFTPPFGYYLEDGRLHAADGEFETVCEIFSMYLSWMTLDEIAYSLNREGILTRKGNPWNKFNLRNILHNPVYAGYMRWEDTRQRHDADTAVTVEEFNQVQMLFASKVRDPKKRDPKLLIVREQTLTMPMMSSSASEEDTGAQSRA